MSLIGALKKVQDNVRSAKAAHSIPRPLDLPAGRDIESTLCWDSEACSVALLCIRLLPGLLQLICKGLTEKECQPELTGGLGHRISSSSSSFLPGKTEGWSEPTILNQTSGLEVPSCAMSTITAGATCYRLASLLPIRSSLPMPTPADGCHIRSSLHRKASVSVMFSPHPIPVSQW